MYAAEKGGGGAQRCTQASHCLGRTFLCVARACSSTLPSSWVFSDGVCVAVAGHIQLGESPEPFAPTVSRYLALLGHQILCQRGLNQPWSGGLSSYSLINMMITVLQRAEVERACARRIVARSHAAAQAAAHIVRQGVIPLPQVMPPLSPQMSIGPQPPAFGPPPPPPQAAATTATVHGHMASDYETMTQEMRDLKIDHADSGDGSITQSQGQPTGETAVEDGGSGLVTASCRAGVGRGKSQAYVAAAGVPSGLNTEVSGDVHSNNPRVMKNVNAEVGDGKRQRASSALDDTADRQGSSASTRRTSSWGESNFNLSAGAGILPTGGERGMQTKSDGFSGAAVAAGSGKCVLPNGLSTGALYGPVRAETALPEEATQAPRAANTVAGTGPSMYRAQAGQAPMQGPMLPVQGPMPPPPPPTAPPVPHSSIGFNADLFHMKHMEITLSQEEMDCEDFRYVVVFLGCIHVGYVQRKS